MSEYGELRGNDHAAILRKQGDRQGTGFYMPDAAEIKHVLLEPKVHKRLLVYKARNGFRRLTDAVDAALSAAGAPGVAPDLSVESAPVGGAQ